MEDTVNISYAGTIDGALIFDTKYKKYPSMIKYYLDVIFAASDNKTVSRILIKFM